MRRKQKEKRKENKKKTAAFFWRSFFIIAGGIGICWFMVPVLVGRLINIGSVTGILVCGLIFAYGIFMKTTNRILSAFWKKRTGKILLGLLMGIAAVILALVIILTTNMILAVHREPAEDATVVVLGCRVYGENASLSLMERLTAAEDYLKTHPEAVCILSGGQGEGEEISEAECMYRYLSEQGIEQERLYREDASTSTRENMAFSRKIIEEEGLSTNIAVVTNEYHIYRASLIAKEQGLTPASIPASTAPWLFPAYYMRELYGILYEWIF